MGAGHGSGRSDDGFTHLRTVVVRFRVAGSLAQLDAQELALHRDDRVIVESEHGPAVATVLMEPESHRVRGDLPKVLRKVNAADEELIDRARAREQEALAYGRQRIHALQQPMKLVDVEIAHSGNRAVFYFTSNERVDFRALVKDLAKRFHTRIEMRQIGVRDAARHTGGVGICGRELCCSTWLPEFRPVSIRMAKDQNLALNHDKLSGVCGRLRCCLRYEQELYQEGRRNLPRPGRSVITPQGPARVRDINVLEQRVHVELDNGSLAVFGADEIAPPPEPEQKRHPPRGFEHTMEGGQATAPPRPGPQPDRNRQHKRPGGKGPKAPS